MTTKNGPKDKGKTLEQGREQQLSLFQIMEPSTRLGDYSNSIELYDALPKYVWDRRELDTLQDSILTRSCKVRGSEYTIKIKPALMEKKNGKTVLIYPGAREEMIEDGLRKLAVNGKAKIIDDRTGVTFSLHQLQKELARTGHSYSIDEIKESLLVLQSSTIQVIAPDGDAMVSGNFFYDVGLTTRDEIRKGGSSSPCYVIFNRLVHNAIMGLTFRQYNYRLGMSIKSPLARYIFKRMSHYWTQASPEAPYSPHLISYLKQSPRGVSEQMRDNVRAMKNALKTLEDHKVVSNYDERRIQDGRKLLDIHYDIYPHENFIKEIKASNAQHNKTQQKGRELTSS